MTPSLMRLTLFRTAEGSGGEKAWFQDSSRRSE